MKASEVIAKIAEGSLTVPSASENLRGDGTSPMVASKGAGSVDVLRRRCGKGWNYIGFAVWSCKKQSYVAGSWSRPLDFEEAHATLKDMAWEG